jgi:hypothetical protein
MQSKIWLSSVQERQRRISVRQARSEQLEYLLVGSPQCSQAPSIFDSSLNSWFILASKR